MQISDRGILEIAEHEGIVLGPYQDSRGVWTYGVGHTSGAGKPRPDKMKRTDTRHWSDDRVRQEVMRALGIFDNDLGRCERRVSEAIHVSLKQHEFDALVSFNYNTGGIEEARLTNHINAGKKDGDAFMGWTKPPEIIPRRRAEQALFRTGDYTADAIPIYDAHGDGSFSRRGTIDGDEVLRMMMGAAAPPPPREPVKVKQGFIARLIRAIMKLFRRA